MLFQNIITTTTLGIDNYNPSMYVDNIKVLAPSTN
jgi:hypothetical protein